MHRLFYRPILSFVSVHSEKKAQISKLLIYFLFLIIFIGIFLAVTHDIISVFMIAFIEGKFNNKMLYKRMFFTNHTFWNHA